MVCDTPPFQDAFTHEILNSYLKEYNRYAPDSMQFLETRSEFKVSDQIMKWGQVQGHSDQIMKRDT